MTTLTQLLGVGKPRAAQLNIGDIFSFQSALHEKGFTGIKDANLEDTLVTTAASSCFSSDLSILKGQLCVFLNAFGEKEFRKKLRLHIFEKKPAPTCPSIDGLHFDDCKNAEKRFANTFELLIAYLAVTELGALSAGYGVHIDGAPQGSDFDCIASFRNRLVYFELKSGKKLDRGHIKTFVQRHCFLHGDLSILFVDFQGINEDVIKRAEGIELYSKYKVSMIRKLQAPDSQETFYQLAPNLILADLHHSDRVVDNLRGVMRYFAGYEALNMRMNYKLIEPEALGYHVEVLV